MSQLDAELVAFRVFHDHEIPVSTLFTPGRSGVSGRARVEALGFIAKAKAALDRAAGGEGRGAPSATTLSPEWDGPKEGIDRSGALSARRW